MVEYALLVRTPCISEVQLQRFLGCIGESVGDVSYHVVRVESDAGANFPLADCISFIKVPDGSKG